MKKILLLVAAAFCFSVASAKTFDVGSRNITAVVGFGGGYGIPISISYEQGIYSFAADHKLGLGAHLAICDIIAPAAECNYHYVGFNKWDLYGGLRLGYAFTESGFFYNAISLGANYSFNDTWALNLEAGTGAGSLGVGVSYSF